MEAVVLDQTDTEQTQIRPELIHQLVLTAIGSRRRGEVELTAEDCWEYVELLVVEAKGGRRQGRAAAATTTAAAAATDGGTDAARTGTPGTSGQVVSQGDAGVTWSR